MDACVNTPRSGAPKRTWTLWATLAAASVAPIAMGQEASPTEPAPKFIVVTREDAALRSRDLDRAYAVDVLKPGETLRLDTEVGPWLRVYYPTDVPVFVSVDNATVAADGKTLKLKAGSKLRAPHASQGWEGSWISASAEPLAAGTELPVVEIIRDDAGTPVAYAVRAPAQARAFIRRRDSRAATDQEAQEALALWRRSQGAPEVLAAPERGGQPTGTTPVGPEGAGEPTGRPTPANAEGQPGRSLLDEMRVPTQPGAETGGADTPGENTTQAEGTNAPPIVIEQGGGEPGSEAGAGTEPAGESDVLSLQSLIDAYDEMLEQPAEDAEWQELLAEHQAALEKIEGDPFSERLADQLRARIKLIEIRIAFQERILKQWQRRRAQEDPSFDPEAVRMRVAAMQRDHGYNFVGRLLPSSLYDGKLRPLMYRLRPASGVGPTIGFVRPTGDHDWAAMLGKVVGIRGERFREGDSPVDLIRVQSIRAVEMQEPGSSPDDR